MKVAFGKFGGIIPRVSDHSLGSVHASMAHNVKLRNGRLEPWRELYDFSSCAAGSLSFHIHGCCPVCWPAVVQAAEVSPDWGRFYITGRQAYPEAVLVDEGCAPTYYRLGVPAPVSAPAASGTAECDRDTDARSYVYTYMNAWGDEGAPSPASMPVAVVKDGDTVMVTGLALPPDGFNIKYANIYRTGTGFRAMQDKSQRPVTEYLYVATISMPSASYSDSIPLAGLGPPLDTYKVRMPPVALKNITAVGVSNRLAGSVGNVVHISENHQLHNWPVKYSLTLDSNIIHMGSLDQKLFITTDTKPYVIDVSSCEDLKCVPVIDTDVPLPDISYQYSSSFVMTQHGIIYSSPLGLILIDPAAKWHLLTAKWFSEDDWQMTMPETARLAYWEGYLFCVTDRVSFMLNIDSVPYADMAGAELTTISDKPVDLRRDAVGKLFMLFSDGRIGVWDSGDQYRTFEWVSRELTGGPGEPGGAPMSNTWSPVSAKIRTTGTEFTLISPLQSEAYQRMVYTEAPFRLPRVGRHMWYKVRMRGTNAVEFFDMGTAHWTVNPGA